MIVVLVPVTLAAWLPFSSTSYPVTVPDGAVHDSETDEDVVPVTVRLDGAAGGWVPPPPPPPPAGPVSDRLPA